MGCEVRTLDDWIANAEVIDAAHDSPGLHKQTRALAMKIRVAAAPARRATRRKK